MTKKSSFYQCSPSHGPPALNSTSRGLAFVFRSHRHHPYESGFILPLFLLEKHNQVHTIVFNLEQKGKNEASRRASARPICGGRGVPSGPPGICSGLLLPTLTLQSWGAQPSVRRAPLAAARLKFPRVHFWQDNHRSSAVFSGPPARTSGQRFGPLPAVSTLVSAGFPPAK